MNEHGYQCVKARDHFGMCVPPAYARPYTVWMPDRPAGHRTP